MTDRIEFVINGNPYSREVDSQRRLLWVLRMREQPFYVMISGFKPVHVTDVEAFCDFVNRPLGLDPTQVQHLDAPATKRR